MPGLLPDVDPDGLLEYSVVYTDRALNHMSAKFQRVMTDVSTALKAIYRAHAVAIVPGGGTYGMEAVARQLATGQKVLIVRNGWFSYRWSQILQVGGIAASELVLKAQPVSADEGAPYAPPPIEEVVATIAREQPGIVCVAHVETASGILLPDDYLRRIGEAVRAVNGLFVVDCVASGAVWLDMPELNIDVLLSAPQKGWSATPCAALVMLSERGRERVESTQSTSFACDLRKWLEVMSAYERGGHMYHATLPTDALAQLRDALVESRRSSLSTLRNAQWQLGQRIRATLEGAGFASVAAEGFKAPSVVVSYTQDADVASGKKLRDLGLQVAAGIPLACDEPASFRTFRVGLFGLDKLLNIDRTVRTFARALEQLR